MEDTEVLAGPTDGVAVPVGPVGSTPEDLAAPSGHRRFPAAEVAVAVAGFVAFCVVVLTRSTALLEPDDSSYLGSIVALTHGHLWLTTAQVHQLAAELQTRFGTGLLQWVHLPDGRWISEKNPGYPVYALPFQLLGVLRAAPLVAAGLASTSLFVAGRRWLGRWGGTWAVLLFLASGAAMAFAWRPTMPTFSDAAFVAAGVAALLWTLLADDAPARRRTLAGLAGFLSLELATAMRYTNVVVVLVTVAAVAVMARRCRVPLRSLAWWTLSLGVAGGAVGLFNLRIYGGATRTGYGAGVITFSTGAVVPNLRLLPGMLVSALPGLLLGLAALVWMAVRLARARSAAVPPETARRWRTDAVVGAWLGLGWLALWGLYSAYTWTAQMGRGGGPGGPGRPGAFPGGAVPGGGAPVGGVPVGQLHGGLPSGAMGGQDIHLIRFYLPAIGIIALLGAWLLTQLPRWIPAIVVSGLAVFGVLSFHQLTAGGGFGAGGPGVSGIPSGVPAGVPGGGSGGLPGSRPDGGRPDGPAPFPSGPRPGPPPGGVPAGIPPSGGAPPAGLGGPGGPGR